MAWKKKQSLDLNEHNCISYSDIPQGGNTQYQHGSPHVPLKPAKRSATPEHMLSDQVWALYLWLKRLFESDFQGGVEMRQLGPHSRTAHSPQVSASKVDNFTFLWRDCSD